MRKRAVRLPGTVPAVYRQRQWPPRLPNGILISLQKPKNCGGGLIRSAAHPLNCGGNDDPIEYDAQTSSSLSLASQSTSAIYNNGSLTHSILWMPPLTNRVQPVQFNGPTASTILDVLNAAVLQVENNYLWIEGVNIAIATYSFSMTWENGSIYGGIGDYGDGINLFIGNPNSMAYVLIPPGSKYSHCLAWQLIYTAAQVATIIVGAKLVNSVCFVNPVVAVTCFLASSLVAALAAEVMQQVIKKRDDACDGVLS